MSHYYSSNQDTKHQRKNIQVQVRGESFSFVTDAGVFSKSGLDFGSRLLLETMDLRQPKSVLDLGCGYGPIGICTSRLYPDTDVLMVDVNERAVALAKENAERNGCHLVEVMQSDGFAQLTDRFFDVILLNPPIRAGKKLIYQLFHEAKAHLHPDGALWIVIRKQQGAPSALKELQSIYLTTTVVKQKSGYWIIAAM